MGIATYIGKINTSFCFQIKLDFMARKIDYTYFMDWLHLEHDKGMLRILAEKKKTKKKAFKKIINKMKPTKKHTFLPFSWCEKHLGWIAIYNGERKLW